METKAIYASPASDLLNKNAVVWDGDFIKTQNPARLPACCIGCGAVDKLGQTEEKLTYLNPLTFFWILLSPIALIIAYFVFRKQLSISYSRCAPCTKKATLWGNIAKISWVLFVVGIVVRILIGKQFFMLQMIVILGSPLLALFATAMKDTQLSVKDFREPIFVLKGFNKAFVAKLKGQSR